MNFQAPQLGQTLQKIEIIPASTAAALAGPRRSPSPGPRAQVRAMGLPVKVHTIIQLAYETARKWIHGI
jgi:hypothetical protein